MTFDLGACLRKCLAGGVIVGSILECQQGRPYDEGFGYSFRYRCPGRWDLVQVHLGVSGVGARAELPASECRPEEENKPYQKSSAGKSVGWIGSDTEICHVLNTLAGLCGGEGGTRTPDPAIMSRVL